MVDYYIPHTVFILFLYIAIKSTHTFTTEMLQKFSVCEWASSLQRQALETVNLRAASQPIMNLQQGSSILFSPCIQGIGTCNCYLSLFLGLSIFSCEIDLKWIAKNLSDDISSWFWKWLCGCLPPTGYLRPECGKIYGHTWRHFGAISWPSEALWRHMTRGSFGVIMIPDGTALPVQQYPNVPCIRAPSSPWQNDKWKIVCYFNWVLLLSAQTVKGHLI